MDASVIIPAYNSEKTIADCVRALKSQEYRGKFEIIVVDDGSTDKTAQFAAKAGAKVMRQKNAGPAKARNLGAKNAKGKILLFTDSDCIAEPSWLEEMLKPFSDKSIAGVQGAYKTGQQSLVARFVQYEIEERYEKMKKAGEGLDWIGSYSAAYRKDDFFSAGGFDESFPKASGEDPELSFKISKKGRKLAFNPRAIVYHTHPESIAKYFWVKFYRAFYRVNLYSKHPDKMASDSYTTGSIKLQIAAGYFGTIIWLLVPALYLAKQDQIAGAVLAANTILFVAATATVLMTFWSIFGKDWKAGVFAILMIQVRTAAFMLGLPAGIIKQKVLK